MGIKVFILPWEEQGILALTLSYWRAVLGLIGMEIKFSTAARMVLCFGFVAKAVLLTR